MVWSLLVTTRSRASCGIGGPGTWSDPAAQPRLTAWPCVRVGARRVAPSRYGGLWYDRQENFQYLNVESCILVQFDMINVCKCYNQYWPSMHWRIQVTPNGGYRLNNQLIIDTHSSEPWTVKLVSWGTIVWSRPNLVGIYTTTRLVLPCKSSSYP